MSAPAVSFPDAEQVVIDHLDGLLADPVRLTIPNPRPVRFVTVRRVGGPRRDLVTDQATLAVEAWAQDADGRPTPTAAKALLSDARKHIAAMAGSVVGGVTCYRVSEVSGPANLPDPDSRQARYTYTVQVAMRAAASV